jgi:hypothetical protein
VPADPDFGDVSHQQPVLLLIDELQTTYGKDPSLYAALWGYIKSLLQGNRNVLLSTIPGIWWGCRLMVTAT